ncbi:MAG: Z1 domain-containing protein [Candidatus Poseidoniales archaeon]
MSSFSGIEKHLEMCLEFDDEGIHDYIRKNGITGELKLALLQRLGLSSGVGAPAFISLPKMPPKTLFNKKQHAGIYEHYLSTLRANKHFGEDAVASIDKSVRETRLRMNLREPTDRINAYGLVIGRIQSGKTAHLIGTILHALDSDETNEPFDTVIILSGLIDDLRMQTRDRFEKVLKSYSGTSIEILPQRDKDLNAGNLKQNDEFRKHLAPHEHRSRILVVKKNHKILENILTILQERPVHARKRYLIIDDEADHASMDTNASNYETGGDVIDEDPSLTNQLLRQINQVLGASARCWYIGYTATPYANLLMDANLTEDEGEFGLPLFPRDFLHALPKPENHLDNEYYFATPPGHQHVVLRVPPEPDTDKEEQIVNELFHRHLLTQIIKDYRNLDIHHTTLVHTDISVDEHHRFVESFRSLLKLVREDKNPASVAGKMKALLDDYPLDKVEKTEIESNLDVLASSWDLVAAELRKIEIVEVNRRPQTPGEETKQDLEYSRGRFKRSYIAVGGTRLSRGLTLEGLTTTWFTRAAQTPVFDTMLQMARWCGYRMGYADLVKIYTTADISGFYQHITRVEEDIRRQVDALPPDADPMETLVWIKEHKDMIVTAKMPADFQREHWGEVRHPHFWSYETPYFGIDPGKTAKTVFDALKSLVSQLGGGASITTTPLSGKGSFLLSTGVRNQKVKKFLDAYRYSYEASDYSLSAVRLRAIMDHWADDYEWNIGFHSPSKRAVKVRENVRGLDLGLVQRTTEDENPQRFSIVQSSNDDVYIDLAPGGARNQPLLLIYALNPASIRRKKPVGRVFDASVKDPPLGIGIVLPNELIGDGGTMIARKKGDEK